MLEACFILLTLSKPISGRICEMLRNHEYFEQPNICREDCFQETSDKTESKG